jgi:cobaltochelatase CobS
MTITIQNVLDHNETRDAKRILRRAVLAAVDAGGAVALKAVNDCVEAATESRLVNDESHPHTRKIASVTFNQILDRMNVAALTIVLNAECMTGNGGIRYMQQAFINEDSAEIWPFDDAGWSEALKSTTEEDLTPWLDVQEVVQDDDVEAVSTVSQPNWDEDLLTIANMAAARATNGDVESIYDMYSTVGSLTEKIEELKSRPATAAPQEVHATGDIPNGSPRRALASDVFGISDPLLNFEITVYDWDGPNPLVPSKMQWFKFDVDVLADALWARERKQNAWFVGHTGTGKSTNVEQICAYTGNMFQRVNFDSDITRLEFVGKVDVKTDDDGAQVTTFTDGILPIAMQMPCILMLDEADAVRGDIAYVLQPVLEGKSLRLLEDGGRMVHPHPEFCIMATANTVGAGDNTGMYSAAVKMQSKAAMNRYNIFINVGYMDTSDEMDVICKVVPDVNAATITHLTNFVNKYRHAMDIGEITSPISPRNTITIAQYTTDFEKRIGVNDAFKRALERNLFNSMDEGERAIAVGIADRVIA